MSETKCIFIGTEQSLEYSEGYKLGFAVGITRGRLMECKSKLEELNRVGEQK